MNIAINYDLFWTILAALCTYRLIFGVTGAIFNRLASECSSNGYGNGVLYMTGNTGVGPGGMVVKSRDSLR